MTLPNGVSTEYQYDLASRLTALIYRNALGLLGDLTYQYDTAGNRISVGGSFARTLLPDAVPSATYDQGNRQLAFGTKTMTFDDNGNLLTETDPSGTLTYTWDARNRLTAMSGPTVNGSFGYDALGRRAQKIIGGVASDFLYDGLDIVKETGGTGEVSYLRTLAIDEALTRTDTVDTLHFLADALGSTVALTDPSGASATTYTYEPYGRIVVEGTAANTVQFTGRENDQTGLYGYRARYYDPRRGRFLSEDPLGSLTIMGCGWRQTLFLFHAPPRIEAIDLLNLYAYVRNRPTMLSDPTGLGPCEDDWAICQQSAKSRNVECVGSVMTGYLACAAAALAFCAGKGPLAVPCLVTMETACAATAATLLGACSAAYVSELAVCTYEYARCRLNKSKSNR